MSHLLIIELGIQGLLAMLGLQMALFYMSITRIRKIVDAKPASC